MATAEQITFIAEQMDEQAAAIYTDMIPEYQSGYADYVYQTDKEDVQLRRIKNLNKSFLRLLTQEYYYLQPLSQAAAEEVATWAFPASYALYDRAKEAALLTDEEREGRYFQVLHNGAFHGFAIIDPVADGLDIHLGTNPRYIGQGLGRGFVAAVESHIMANLEPKEVLARVAASDEQARYLFSDCGYKLSTPSAGENVVDSSAFVTLTKKLS